MPHGCAVRPVKAPTLTRRAAFSRRRPSMVGQAAQASAPVDRDSAKEGVAEKLATLLAKRARTAADLARLGKSGETQLSRTDADARLLTKSGQTIAGYIVQAAVDDRHRLIVASKVVNNGNDSGQLHAMAVAAKVALGAETLTALADVGYYNGETLRACEADAITAYVPPAERNRRLPAQGRFGRGDFHYDVDANVYRCPAGEQLRPMNGRKQDAAGKSQIRYVARSAACRACSLRAGCLTEKAKLRTVYRWEHEDVIERHLARMDRAGVIMRRRSALVEHPFGTLKCRAGCRHFLLRGFDKVRGEWSLMALGYNFIRVLNIFGIQGFIASLAG